MAGYHASSGRPATRLARCRRPTSPRITHISCVRGIHLAEVAGFDGRRCTLNTIAERDRASGEWTMMNRLTPYHVDALLRAGFDPLTLGGGFR